MLELVWSGISVIACFIITRSFCGGIVVTNKAILFIWLYAAFCNMLLANSAAALSMEYLYRGNHFVEIEGFTGLFSPTDHVTAQFTIDCALAHSEGDCRNLPYDDYFSLGAIDVKSMNFSAGPVVLPTADGNVEVRVFSFSTDYQRRIVDWDMDLFLTEPWLNVDTDNVNGGIDSAGAPGESASVSGQPGIWGNELPKAETDFDLKVSKTVDNPTPVGPQPTVEFKISVVNKGPGSVTDVVVLDQLPPQLSIPEGMAAYTSTGYYDQDSGRWEVGDLEHNLPEVMTIPALVKADPQPACIINSASTDTEGDVYPGDNESSVSIRLPYTEGCANLIIEELFLYQDGSRCEVDTSVSFQIRVRNAGPDVATNVVLDIEELLFEAPGLKISNPNCNEMRCTWPVMEVGQSQTASGGSEHISINGSSDRFNLSESEKWKIKAEISSSGEVDYLPENNTSSKQTQIDPHERGPSCDAPTGGPDWDLSGVGGGGGCFIATTSYGSKDHPNVRTLREFRDNVLMKWGWGRSIVEFYYHHSPEIACYISERESMRTVTRWLLTPIVFAITYPWLSLVVLISLGVLLYVVLMRLQRQPT
jgi:uncharacterized repeat protein (TIGR01451 family)